MDIRERSAKNNLNRHPWEMARYQLSKVLLSSYLKKDAEITILDIGSGDLFVAKEIMKDFPKVKYFAVDSAYNQTIRAGIENEGFSNIKLYKSLDELLPVLQQVDIVLLMDVIEHVADDIAFMEYIKSFSFIKPFTLFYITVPAFQKLFSHHDVFLGHFRRYTRTMLLDHLQKASYGTLASGYFFTSLLVPRIMEVIRERLLGRKQQTTGLVEWGGGSILTQSIKNVLLTDFYFTYFLSKIGVNFPGLSTYCLCRLKSV